jgi:diguanylate cyclase (GGDEF)-like protein
MPEARQDEENRPIDFDAQLRRGFLTLVFSPDIESQYQDWSQRHQVVPALICAGLTLVIWLGFAAYDFARLDFFARAGMLPPSQWALLALRWTVAAALIWVLSNARWLQTHLAAATFAVFMAIGTGAAVTSHIYGSHGLPRSDISLLIVVMSAFLPIGLSFYQAVIAALAVLCITAISGISLLPPGEQQGLFELLGIMTIAVLFGGIGGYLREYSRREQFLLRQLLTHQAQFDPLTDLANRRMLIRRAEKALAHARRERQPVVFGVLDVDFFKGYNDRYGHGAGDVALASIAGVLRGATRRPMDLASRMGGEEFGILFYDTDIARARSLFEQICTDIAALDIVHDGSPMTGHLTVSLGVAQFDGSENLDTLYARADALLYSAKQAGRNRIVFEGEV